MFLELTGEMLGIVESETFGCLRDSGSAHQELLGSLHDEAADMGGSGVARQFTDQVADEQTIDIVIVERVATVLQLVVVDD